MTLINRFRHLGVVSLAVLALALLVAGTVSAASDCPRGQLLEQFCDRDGDLVADLPTDGKYLNPSTLIFSYTPVEDPAVYRNVWADFLKYMEKITGKRVQFFAVQNYAAQLEALRAGRLHVAGVNTGSVPFAVNTAGFVPFAMMANEDDSFGYEMEVIVPANSDIQTLADVRGRTLALVSPTSNSGYKAPTALLKAELGLEVDKDYKTTFSGRHDNSILGVANGDYEVAAIANTVMFRMIQNGVVDADQIRTIYKSQTFPTTAYGHVYNLDPELAAKVREAFLTFDWKGTALDEEFKESKFIPITYKEHWDVIRKIDKANGVEYR